MKGFKVGQKIDQQKTGVYTPKQINELVKFMSDDLELSEILDGLHEKYPCFDEEAFLKAAVELGPANMDQLRIVVRMVEACRR